ncbi:MAG: DUF1501 domain-containing protein [Actinobacteria bacterium]|nr:DUF1501 domain-containing protein [Actinomycetota bacterium]NDH81373.1 DUF1501 domain-containing protein [Actinomycetota bacterium]NDH99895.1 DUF1501 domain-containing protein [Actinomycetota bacterium]
MDLISRRKFLALTSGVAIGAVAPILSLQDVAQAAIDRPLPANTPILVALTLYGGNDGLNTLIPYSDSLYFSSRPGISYPVETLLTLDSSLALNPSMGGIKTLWDEKKVAIIRGVGYPKPDRSHFSSMAKWQTGNPLSHISTGWLGRWIDTQPTDPMLAISLGSVLPPLLAGAKKSGSALPLGGLVIPSGQLALDCARLSTPSSSDSKLMALAASTMKNLFNISDSITPVLKKNVPGSAVELPTVNGGNAGGDSNLSQQLDVVAKLIDAGAPTRVWSVSLGGFDTHANEANAQAALLGSVSNSISRFMTQLKSTTRSKDVVVMVYSEFGRRVVGNASQGTDHGTSGPVFVIGDRIAGGFYGDQPSLSKLVDGDLAVTTDFRSIYATILEKVLKAPPEKILNGWKTKIPFYKAV